MGGVLPTWSFDVAFAAGTASIQQETVHSIDVDDVAER